MSGVLTGVTLPLPLLDNPYMLPCVVGSIQQVALQTTIQTIHSNELTHLSRELRS